MPQGRTEEAEIELEEARLSSAWYYIVSINTEKVLAPLCQRAIYLHMNVVGIYYGRIKCAQRFKFTFTFFDLFAENAK